MEGKNVFPAHPRVSPALHGRFAALARRLALALLALVVLVDGMGCKGTGEEELTPEEQALADEVEPYRRIPEEDEVPLPPSGWYTLELAGDTIDVFRDEYGVPHVFAPSIEAAFRAQGYVISEDRPIQTMRLRDAVLGRASIRNGKGIGSDERTRTNGYPPGELQEMLDELRPDQLRYMTAYMEGMNEYFRRHVPYAPPATMLEIAAGSVYFMNEVGDIGRGQDRDLFELLRMLRFIKGDEFSRNMLDDCMPLNVPIAPTTDHSDPEALRKRGEDPASDEQAEAARESGLSHASFDPASMISIFERNERAKEWSREEGLLTEWGSQAWAVSKERSATGNALFAATPFTGYNAPGKTALVHLVAPGINLSGICFPGAPGVLIGHNDRIAWGSTSGLVKESDTFVEELNPENQYQYKFNGKWVDMEVIDWPIPFLKDDDTLGVSPFALCRTVHGPVVQWELYNNRAYTLQRSYDRMHLKAFAAHLDMNLARSVEEFGQAVRQVATSHSYLVADVDGNIGYFLSGRIPQRHPDQDRRLPTPGTGECEWRGVTVATDLVASVNPPEGWFQSSNNKPSAKIHGWWPEVLWGHRLHEILGANDPIDWDTFVSINRADGEHHFAGPYFQPYLVNLLRDRAVPGEPLFEQALEVMEAWDSKFVSGDPAVLIMNEWIMETMVELLSPDFGPFVERSMSLHILQLFGPITFRVLRPECSGIRIKNDYLHGRDKDEVAFRCLVRVLKRLSDEHGPDISEWPFEAPATEVGDLTPFPSRGFGPPHGVYWMVVDMGSPMRVKEMMLPGQSELHRSPHYQDQYDLFLLWQLRDQQYTPEAFGRTVPAPPESEAAEG